MSLVKGEVSKVVSDVPGIPAGKKAATVETATSSLLGSLKGQLNAKNLPGLLSAFSGGGSAASSKTGAIGSSVVTALTQKVGLQPAVAQQIVSKAVPLVMSLFSKKVADDNEPDFNIGSLLGGLAGHAGGEEASIGGVGKMLGSLSGLFKK